jgi:hypothetical protein
LKTVKKENNLIVASSCFEVVSAQCSKPEIFEGCLVSKLMNRLAHKARVLFAETTEAILQNKVWEHVFATQNFLFST